MLDKSSRGDLKNLLRRDVLVTPDTRAHVAGAGGEEAAGSGAGRDGDDRVLVALKHELGAAGAGVPELDAAVLGAGEDPGSVWGEGDTEDEVLENVSIYIQ